MNILPFFCRYEMSDIILSREEAGVNTLISISRSSFVVGERARAWREDISGH